LQIGMLVLALCVALAVDDLGIMFSFVGATGATMVSFILPGAAYYHMHARPEAPFWQQETLTVGAYCLFVAGCVFAPMGVAFLFIN
jgi:amino acid permease